MSYEYSNHEYTEMVRVLAKSRDNVARACHEFVRLFPNLPTPSRSLMLDVTKRLRDYGQFLPDESSESESDGGDVKGVDKGREQKPVKNNPYIRVPAGKGVPLGHLSNITASLSRFRLQELKMLHQYLFGKTSSDRTIMHNIKKFKGYEFHRGSSQFKSKFVQAVRMEPGQLKTMCEMLDLDTKGGPKELATRLVEFLDKPTSNSPHARQTRNAAGVVKTYNRAITDEEIFDAETKVHGTERAKGGSHESDGSSSSSDSNDAASPPVRVAVSENDCREAEAKVTPDKKRPATPLADYSDVEDAVVQSTKDENASGPRGYGRAKEDGSEDSGEDSDRPADKRPRRPPTNDEIKRYLRRMLEGAKLEQITMKTVCKEVYRHYPYYDLAHKKDFIKATVTSLL